jgi:proteasome component ECM29
MEQHTDRLGIDASRLENLRVSASKSSPMGDTLDICARVADQASLEALVPRLATLAKRGVGLNTRAGTARFIGSLATRLGSDVAPYSGPLIKVRPACPVCRLG